MKGDAKTTDAVFVENPKVSPPGGTKGLERAFVSGTRIRSRVLAFVGGLIVLSLAASSLSLLQISKVNRTLDSINRVSLPLNKLFAQMQIDVEVFRREATRGIGSVHWNDPHWNPQQIPAWITEVIEGELDRAQTLVARLPEGSTDWKTWMRDLDADFVRLKTDGEAIAGILANRDLALASGRYPAWNALL